MAHVGLYALWPLRVSSRPAALLAAPWPRETRPPPPPGLLLWELAHRATPFAEYDGMKVVVDVAPTGQRPALQLRAGLEPLGPLITSCWHRDPTARPAVAACTEELGQLVDSVKMALSTTSPRPASRVGTPSPERGQKAGAADSVSMSV